MTTNDTQSSTNRYVTPECPEFPIMSRGTVEYMEICSEDGRTMCMICRSLIGGGESYYSVFGVRICGHCFRCPVCLRTNDSSTEPVTVDGDTFLVHAPCAWGVDRFNGRHFETQYEKISKAKPPKPGFYHRRTDADAPRTEFESTIVYVLADAEVAEAFAEPEPDQECALCPFEEDEKLLTIVGAQVHEHCVLCRACDHEYDDNTTWVAEATDDVDSKLGYWFTLCAFCFSRLYESCNCNAGDHGGTDEPQESNPTA